jgi:hypothetical protein
MGTMYALVSPGGSPGVTTAALALALTWPGPAPVTVAECDPAGGDVLAGLLGGQVQASRGLVHHAIEAGRDPLTAAASLPGHLVPVDTAGSALLLPGLTDPRQAVGLAQAWPAVASVLTAQPGDVIADCGRVDAGPGEPTAVLAAARAVVMVMRPSLRQVWAARPRIELLVQLIGGPDLLRLLLISRGSYSAREVAETLSVPVLASLPDDSNTAALLSDGLGRHGQLGSSPLLRSARNAGQALRSLAADGVTYAVAADAPARP